MVRLRDIVLAEGSDAALDWIGLPTDPKFYRRHSKELVFCLACYMDRPWAEHSAATRQRITKAFDAEMPALKKPMKLHRGIGLDSLDDLRPGTDFRTADTLRFAGFLSASRHPWVPDEIVRDGGGKIQVYYALRTKPGARGLDTFDPELRRVLEQWDRVDGLLGQAEVVLARGTEFKVVSKAGEDYDDGGAYWYLQLEQIK